MPNKRQKICFLSFSIIFFILFSNIILANTYLTQDPTWDSNLTGAEWASIALGDVDKDGNLDLAQIGCNAESASVCSSYLAKIYINNGTGFEENSTWQQNLTAVHYGSIAWGDVDNDGDLDLALTGCNNGGSTTSACLSGGHQSFIYINNGTSLVENLTWKGDIINVARGSIAFGDVDNDGDLDLALTGQTTATNIAKIYINNGTGFEENSTWQQDLTGVVQGSTTLVDMDNDDYLDLILVGNSGAGNIARIYINNETAFERNTTWDQNLLGVSRASTAWGDFDNNGRMDLTLTGQSAGDHHRIYNNTGTILIQVQRAGGTDQTLTGIFEGTQALGDYDNDGDLDLFTSGEEEYSTLYLYNGSPFTSWVNDPETGIFNTAFGPSTAWGDLDNDSDLDLILFGYDRDVQVNLRGYVYINNITTSNTPPNASTDFNTSYNNNQLTLQWGNASDDETVAAGLYYNIKVGNKSNNHSIVSGVYGGGDDNGYFGNMMQRKSITLSVPNLQANEVIYWSVQTIDTGLKAGNWSVVQNYTLPVDVTRPTITLNLPVDYNNSSTTTILFNASVSDDTNLTNVTLYGNWSGWHSNETNSTTDNDTSYVFSKDLSAYGDGVYQWLIEAYDATNNSRNSSIRTFTIDTTNPLLNSVTPTNASSWTTSNEVTFTYNITDLTITNCSLIINDVVNLTDQISTSGVSKTFSQNLSNGEYYWGVNCSDSLDQKNGTEVWNLTVSYTAPATGGGGGSSGSGGTTPAVCSVGAIQCVGETFYRECIKSNEWGETKDVLAGMKCEFGTLIEMEEEVAEVENLSEEVCIVEFEEEQEAIPEKKVKQYFLFLVIVLLVGFGYLIWHEEKHLREKKRKCSRKEN